MAVVNKQRVSSGHEEREREQTQTDVERMWLELKYELITTALLLLIFAPLLIIQVSIFTQITTQLIFCSILTANASPLETQGPAQMVG